MKHDRSMKHDSPINKAVYKCTQVTIRSQSISSAEFMSVTVNLYYFHLIIWVLKLHSIKENWEDCNDQHLYPSHYLGFETLSYERELGR